MWILYAFGTLQVKMSCYKIQPAKTLVDWYKLTSKHSEATSGTYANIYQGFILNLGLNLMQYAVFTSNQTKKMLFVPLIRNMNCAITYIYVHKSYPVYDK